MHRSCSGKKYLRDFGEGATEPVGTHFLMGKEPQNRGSVAWRKMSAVQHSCWDFLHNSVPCFCSITKCFTQIQCVTVIRIYFCTYLFLLLLFKTLRLLDCSIRNTFKTTLRKSTFQPQSLTAQKCECRKSDQRSRVFSGGTERPCLRFQASHCTGSTTTDHKKMTQVQLSPCGISNKQR